MNEAASPRPRPRIARQLAAALAVAIITACGPKVTPAVTMTMKRDAGTPRDASVLIDEQYIGPLHIVAARGVRLPIGEHRITIEKDGYFPFDRLVVSDREAIHLDVKLEPIPD